MEIQKDYLCIEQNSRVLCKNIDADFDFQEALPAYLDDVYRVVKCSSCICVTGCEINYNEIKIYGKVFISLTYYNENSSLSYADFEESFTKSVTAESLSDKALVFADITGKYTSYRIINQRRIDIHISSVLHIDVYDKNSCPCIKSCSDSRLKTESVKCSDVINTNISKIEFDEEFSVPSDSPAIKRIVGYDSFADITDIRIIKDKALIKAAVTVNVIYTADNEEEELHNTQYSFNVSKIAEISGIDENDNILPKLSLGNVFLKAKNKNGDKLETINVYGDLYVNSRIIRENTKSIVTDAYILNSDSECQYSNCGLQINGKLINKSVQLTLNYNLNSEITEIKETDTSIVSSEFKKGVLTVNTELCVLALNSGGELTSQTSSADATIQLDGEEYGIADVSISSYDYTIKDNKSITLRLTVNVKAYVYDYCEYKLINDITSNGSHIDSPTVTVYFGKKDENIWDIAKSFMSDSEMIKSENDLNSDVLETDRVLIIPRA